MKATEAISDLRTKPLPMTFCPSANGSVEGNTFPACYTNTMSVAANKICSHLGPTSKDNIDIVVPGEDIEADAPVDVKRYVSETMSSAAPALAAGIASLALLLLRVLNDDEPALREFLQKHKIMHVFEKWVMDRAVSGSHSSLETWDAMILLADGRWPISRS